MVFNVIKALPLCSEAVRISLIGQLNKYFIFFLKRTVAEDIDQLLKYFEEDVCSNESSE